MTRNVSIEDATVEITAGLYDTSEGFRAQVEGDDYPRVHITPQGSVLTGDGTAAPTAYSTDDGGGGGNLFTAVVAAKPASGSFTDGDFTAVNLLGANGNSLDGVPRSATIGVTVLNPDSSEPGLWTLTGSGPCTFVDTQPTARQVVSVGPGGADVPGGMYSAVALSAEGPVDNYELSTVLYARPIAYDNSVSDLSSDDVQGALDELAALIAAL